LNNAITIIEDLIRESLSVQQGLHIQAVAGGDIHHSFSVRFDDPVEIKDSEYEQLFIKLCDLSNIEVLQSEYDSLRLISRHRDIHYPSPVSFLSNNKVALLAMTFHPMSALNATTASNAGEMLAIQHGHTNDKHGWQSDNFIGLTPQINTQKSLWFEFYRDYRLVPQIQLASRNQISAELVKKFDNTIPLIEHVLANRNPLPSLLHGDLWSGNLAHDTRSDRAIFFDPAPYYGDPETDLAMTELFGSLPPSFYQAYQQVIPIESDYLKRKPIYNLYHALNHFNLFGAGYEMMVDSMLTQIQTLNSI